MDAWLRDLEVGPRSRNNVRNSVKGLFNFAIARKYQLPGGPDPKCRASGSGSGEFAGDDFPALPGIGAGEGRETKDEVRMTGFGVLPAAETADSRCVDTTDWLLHGSINSTTCCSAGALHDNSSASFPWAWLAAPRRRLRPSEIRALAGVGCISVRQL